MIFSTSRKLQILILSLISLFVISQVFAGTPHTAGGTVETSFGSTPANSSLTFTAYIVGRASETLTESSAGCGYSAGAWWVQCGNFPTNWSAGDVLHIDFTDDDTDETGSDDITLTNAAGDNGGLTTLIAPAETMTAPNTPSGPSTGFKGQSLSFSTNGGSSSLGHPLEYQFDWGDGNQSGWSSSTSGSHTYNSTGTFSVKARVRCQYHTDKVSSWSANLDVTISLCSLTIIINPTGAGTVTKNPDESGYSYNDVVQLTASGSGSYVFSNWSDDLSGSTNPENITMDGNKSVTANFAEETVSKPTTLTGPSTGYKEQSLSFNTSGSTNNFGHPIEYQFDWGDGSGYSSWGSGSDNHTYSSTGTFQVRSKARCQIHTSVESDWSDPHSVTISYCTLTANVSPGGTGSISKNPDKTGYDYNESVQLTVTPNAGYGFDYWDGDLSGSNNPETIIMDGDKSVTAYIIEESVSKPDQPTGPTTGFKEQSLNFTASGAVSNLGHSLEYRFDWGNGNMSAWGSASQNYTYSSTGTYGVKAQARCQTHTDKISDWSDPLNVSISLCTLSTSVSPAGAGSVSKNPDLGGYDYNDTVQLTATPTDGRYEFNNWSGDLSGSTNPENITMDGNKDVTANFLVETVSTPTIPAGPSSGYKEQSLSFSTSGASSSFGHTVEYRFDWGDGGYSGWGIATRSHTYSGTGTFQVRARARCQNHTDIESSWSAGFSVTISYCTLSITVNPGGSGNVIKSPDKTGYDYNETVQLTASPADGGSVFDSWSGDLSGTTNPENITMNGDKNVTANFIVETISTPNRPNGPSSGITGQTLSYSTGGATSSFGHDVEYRFNWDDGDISGWGTSSDTHSYTSTGTFHIRAQARCASHTDKVSSWSSSRSVAIISYDLTITVSPADAGNVTKNPDKVGYDLNEVVQLEAIANAGYAFDSWSGDLTENDNPADIIMDGNKNVTAHFIETTEVISTPTTPTGPITGIMGQSLSYVTGGAESNLGDDVEYQFDWGDSTLSDWGDSTRDYTYYSSGTMNVKARARCKIHNSVASEWSNALEVIITGYTLSILIDSVETGTVTKEPDKTEYADGDTVLLTPTAMPGYSFDQWSGGLEGTDNPAKIIMDSNKELTAHFVKVGEIVTVPAIPTGPSEGFRGQLLTFFADSSESNLGHAVEYQFDWGDGQFSEWGNSPDQNMTNITRITSPNGLSGLPYTGNLIDYTTGNQTNVTLTVTGGDFNGVVHSEYGAEPDSATDAYNVFNGIISCKGVISYIDESDSPLVLTLSGMQSAKSYNLAFFSNYGDYGWDQASLVTISGAESFTNESSTAIDNNGNPLFSGENDFSTRLPADNTHTGYVARFNNINAGVDGEVVLIISFDGSAGNEYKGKYASALMMQEISGSMSEAAVTAYNDFAWGDLTQSFMFTSSKNYPVQVRARCQTDTAIISDWSKSFDIKISGCNLDVQVEPENAAGNINRFPDQSDYDYGTKVTLTAYANTGYTFNYWNTDLIDTTNSKTIVMDENKTLIANFSTSSDVQEMPEETPQSFMLYQNYPNPFNPETTIYYQLAENCHVKISVYNLKGQLINIVVDEHKNAGVHFITWRAKDTSGNELPSGVYLFRIKAKDFEQVKKMALIR